MTTSELLPILQKMVDELRGTSSILSKKDILKKYANLKDILYLIYNPYHQFYVTSKQLAGKSIIPGYTDLEVLLKDLRTRKITGHAAAGAINGLIALHPNYTELICSILDKDLQVRINSATINSVWEDLIPTFKVALANSYAKVDPDFRKEVWYASRKMDGLRLITKIDAEGECSFFSRKGKELHTLNILEQAVKELNLRNTVLDGELCNINSEGVEDFQSIMKEVHKLKHTIENPHYLIFDILSTEEFENSISKGNYLDKRMSLLKSLIKDNNKFLKRVKQTRVRSIAHVVRMQDMAIAQGWEGLILRKNTEYEGKRSNNMLKVKQFFDDEFEVKKLENHIIPVTDGSSITPEDMLGAVEIEYKGYTVRVGSGFSLDQRRLYYKYPEKLLGATITVQYFAESRDQDGNLSLRFPTVKAIYESGRDV